MSSFLKTKDVVKTDWQQCVICQKSTEEALQCPAESKGKDVGAGYKTLADNIIRFGQLGCMPIALNIERLDEGSGIEQVAAVFLVAFSEIYVFSRLRYRCILGPLLGPIGRNAMS